MRPDARSEFSGRTAGKQVDTWSFDLPDGKSESFTIRLKKDDTGFIFSADPNGDVFRGITASNANIQELRQNLTDLVHDRIDEIWSAEWRKSLVVTLDYRAEVRKAEYGLGSLSKFSMGLDFTSVALNISKPPGNQGQVEVMDGKRKTTLLLRSHRDQFPTNGSRGDISKMSQQDFLFLGENGETRSRIVVEDNPENIEAALAVRETLARFTALLADRISPSHPGGVGLPTPSEMIDLMRLAVDPDAEVSVEDPNMDIYGLGG